jgi:glutathione synthase/RimK-type ligase-like ATP-grasp enzyme
MDKHYLRDLEAKGVAVVPTQFVERGQRRSMASVMREMGWDEAVIKPAVSGAARHTYRVDLDSVTEVEPIASRLLGDEALMVQPFQRDIIERGEVTLVVIGGKCTHGLIKVAKAGDFRVQDDHGGTVHAHEPSAEEVAFAERAIASCAQLPAYGRVDMVRDNSGALAVMELELVEPELWFRLHPPAAEALAEVIAARIER